MDLGIAGKFALVTGGSRGIGKQSALALAGEGVNVSICGRTQETLDVAVKEISSLGVKSFGFICDVSDSSQVQGLYDRVTSQMGVVDILVNNVGGSLSKADILGTNLADFKGTFDINLFGGFELMRLVIPNMQKRKWGRIINIASIWGRENGGNISYMSAKAALIAATKHTAVSLAKDGVLVNSIAPGSIEHSGGSWERFQKDNPPEVVNDFIKQNLPMGKFGWPQPVGDLVAFLASVRAGLITGSSIVIDGGQSHSML